MTLAGVASDFDRDNDVDQVDFGHFQECLSGPGTAQTDPACMDADLNGDGAVADDGVHSTAVFEPYLAATLAESLRG